MKKARFVLVIASFAALLLGTLPAVAVAEHHEKANPCAGKANPCSKKANPCTGNPCSEKANPCKDNPCSAKANPCKANPCKK